MKAKLFLSLSAALLSASLFSSSAMASCESNNSCSWQQPTHHKHKTVKHSTVRVASYSVRHRSLRQVASFPVGRNQGAVVSMIKSMAPSYGVPTWFALRIAKVESGYNPNARGAAGELGVFQLKCATARGIGYRGNCSGLLNASTNVRYGLKYLSMAVHSSHGNLKLAASKHNGGLGRKSLVPRYVAMVF